MRWLHSRLHGGGQEVLRALRTTPTKPLTCCFTRRAGGIRTHDPLTPRSRHTIRARPAKYITAGHDYFTTPLDTRERARPVRHGYILGYMAATTWSA